MGSLMAGWDRPVHDPKAVKYMRNRSLTKEEIDSYWKEKKKTEQEHLEALSPRSQSIDHNSIQMQEELSLIKEDTVKREYLRSNSLPALVKDRRHGIQQEIDHEHDHDHDEVKNMFKKNCWWTRSNWAFLNEPPVIEGEQPRYKYASQYHVTNRGSSLGNGNRKAKTNGNASSLTKSKSAPRPDA